MMRNSRFIAMALGAAVLLVGCDSKSPTAPKPTPVPAFNISLTPEATTAKAGETVVVVAHVTAGNANAPDNTAVTFDISGGQFPPSGATEAVRTTTGGNAAVNVTSSGGTATILGRVPGGSDQTEVIFTGVAPTPGPTPTPDFTPEIFALTPNAGPFEGGTRVTISGTGFQAPVQVLFDDIQAQLVSTTYTEIVCISPSITPTAPNTVTTKQVTVTNISNGRVSNGVGFRYGVTMFISSFTPMEGPADTPTTVTIFGQGFVSPLTVTAGSVAWDVVTVAGTEIVVRTKPLPNNSPDACGSTSVGFRVTLVNTNQTADSPVNFTYHGLQPLITSVQVAGGSNVVGQCGVAGCAACGSTTFTVKGTGFQANGVPPGSAMTVSLEGPYGGSILNVPTSFVDSNTVRFTVSDLSMFTLNTVPCSPPAGGTASVSTAVDLRIRNIRSGCEDLLSAAIVIGPCPASATCTVAVPTPTPTPAPAPTVSGVAPNAGPIAGGTSVIITGTNFVNTGLAVVIGGMPVPPADVSFLDASHIEATTPAHTPANPVAVTVFCGGQSGSLPGGFLYTAAMDVTIAGTGTVTSGDAVSPFSCSTGTCQAVFGIEVPTLTFTTSGVFNGWSGATCGCSGTGDCLPTMDQNRACTATFTP